MTRDVFDMTQEELLTEAVDLNQELKTCGRRLEIAREALQSIADYYGKLNQAGLTKEELKLVLKMQGALGQIPRKKP